MPAELTFIPLIERPQYERMKEYLFRNRQVIDLGAGPLDKLYELVMKQGAQSYHAVDNQHANHLQKKLANKTNATVQEGSLVDYLKQEFHNTTFVASGIDKDSFGEDRGVEELIITQLQKGNKYLGICSRFFMKDVIRGEHTFWSEKKVYAFKNGDHIIILQQQPVPESICVRTAGHLINGGTPFGMYDESFRCYTPHE